MKSIRKAFAVILSASMLVTWCSVTSLADSDPIDIEINARDNDGNIVQFYYGEDSIDTINNRFLMNFKFIGDNFDSYLIKYKPERIDEMIDTKKVREARLNKEIDSNETMLNKYEPWKYLGSVSEKVYQELHDYLINDPDNKFKVSEKFKSKDN